MGFSIRRMLVDCQAATKVSARHQAGSRFIEERAAFAHDLDI
jgi:hypothetical protein